MSKGVILLTWYKYIILLVFCQVNFFWIECPNTVILIYSSFIFLTLIIITDYIIKSSIILIYFTIYFLCLILLFSTGIFQLFKKILFQSTEKWKNTVVLRCGGWQKLKKIRLLPNIHIASYSTHQLKNRTYKNARIPTKSSQNHNFPISNPLSYPIS